MEVMRIYRVKYTRDGVTSTDTLVGFPGAEAEIRKDFASWGRTVLELTSVPAETNYLCVLTKTEDNGSRYRIVRFTFGRGKRAVRGLSGLTEAPGAGALRPRGHARG